MKQTIDNLTFCHRKVIRSNPVYRLVISGRIHHHWKPIERNVFIPLAFWLGHCKWKSHNTSGLAFLTSTAFSHPARPATATDTVASTMSQDSDLTEIKKTKRRLSRMFVYLEKRELVPPSAKRFEDLQKKGRVKEMSFTRIDSAADFWNWGTQRSSLIPP